MYLVSGNSMQVCGYAGMPVGSEAAQGDRGWEIEGWCIRRSEVGEQHSCSVDSRLWAVGIGWMKYEEY